MRLRSRRVTFSFGVPTCGERALTVTGEDPGLEPATALPSEPDPLQLRAAERLGMFPYSDTTHNNTVKDHAA